MKALSFFILFIAQFSIVYSKDKNHLISDGIIKDSSQISTDFPEFEEKWHTNNFNHFDGKETRTFQQRYFVSDKYWDVNTGPIFVYICGEYTCEVPTTRMFPYAMVQEHNAQYLVLEHRYYGKSQLFDNWRVENMTLLTVELALADLAHFITARQEEIQRAHPNADLTRRKVVTVGGSYPGAMSAWFRYKYPHVTDGSLASSAVITTVYDFPRFDEQIVHSLSLTPGCLEIAGGYIARIQNILDYGNKWKKERLFKIFGAGPQYNHDDFISNVNQIFVEKVQYGGRTEMCNIFLSIKHLPLEDQFEALVKMNGASFGPDGISVVQNTSIDFNSNIRQWNWQVCTQIGMFFTPSQNSPITAKRIDLDYWVGYCNRVFGIKMDPLPGIKEINMLFGSTEMRGSNIFFTNGVEDGWQWASMRKITHENTSMTAHVVDCVDCAHCVDLYTEKDSDAQDQKDTRKSIREHVGRWLSGDGFPEDSKDESPSMYLIDE